MHGSRPIPRRGATARVGVVYRALAVVVAIFFVGVVTSVLLGA